MNDTDGAGPEPLHFELRPATDIDLPLGERLRSLSRERGLVDATIGACWWTFVRIYARVFHRLARTGAGHLPARPPFVLVANHSSHLDALVLGASLPRALARYAYPIAAGDTFFESPATATFAAFVLNALPMWRRSQGAYAMQQLRDRLVGEPCGYILFPEGTRTRTGAMGTFKPGLGMLVAGTDVPVVPAWLDGAFDALPPGRSLPRPRRLRLTIGEPLRFPAVSHDRAGWNHVAATTESAVRALMTGAPTS